MRNFSAVSSLEALNDIHTSSATPRLDALNDIINLSIPPTLEALNDTINLPTFSALEILDDIRNFHAVSMLETLNDIHTPFAIPALDALGSNLILEGFANSISPELYNPNLPNIIVPAPSVDPACSPVSESNLIKVIIVGGHNRKTNQAVD